MNKLKEKSVKEQPPRLLNDDMLKKQQKRYQRHQRVRGKISGTAKVPRLGVFRSHQYIYAQLIDDEKGKTIMAASDQKLRKGKRSKADLAKEVGKLIAQKAQERKITKVIFDRGGYKYHGRVKAVAEGAREGGLKF